MSRVTVNLLISLAIASAAVGGAALYVTRSAPRQIACTQEAKLCPDGSAVGRTGPNCEFAACPTPTPIPAPIPSPTPLDCNGPGDSCPSGYTCIQKCGPPAVRIGDPPPGYYCASNDVASKPRMCPICLASNTNISTPSGDVNVKDVTVGMRVWSLDSAGKKIASTVTSVSHTDVPATHHVVHLVLSDGREVWVSPNHPAADGSTVGSLRRGDIFDGATVRSADLVPYWDRATYDLLPDSASRTYWANGVLLKSTLSPR